MATTRLQAPDSNTASVTHLPGDASSEHRNDVRLVGRLSAEPQERTLPSGDRVVTFRLVVERHPEVSRSRRGQRVDTLDCAAWSGRLRRTVSAWQPGAIVEVEGALRRRFRRTPAGPTSRVEVEVRAARRRR